MAKYPSETLDHSYIIDKAVFISGVCGFSFDQSLTNSSQMQPQSLEPRDIADEWVVGLGIELY